jgi:predicted DCC family thiol-disulfide oxidoreductase YuxK
VGPRAYSWRDDPAVPAFPDDRPLVLFDGDCALCSGWARTVLKRDRARIFRLAPVQSPLGRALMVHHGLDPDDPSTMLLLEGGRAFGKTEGSIRVASRLGWPYRAAVLLRLIPGGLPDAVYDQIARRRRLIPGRRWCAMPGPDLDLADRVLG